MNADDRIQILKAQSLVTGIDFVYVESNQIRLDVHFLRPPSTLDFPLVGDLDPANVHICSRSTPEDITRIPVLTLNWVVEDGKDVLQLETAHPGDFSLYSLSILDPDKVEGSLIDPPRIDPYFNHITFSFKANCPSDLDCKTPPHDCPPEEFVDFPVNYQARDFWSYRQALLDFASQRYPDWKDRLEADVGMMLVEMMSALADEMAYYQDRIGREAYLNSATQRRSVKHHARLVDYHVHDGSGAFAWLDARAVPGGSGNLPAGMDIWASGDNGLHIDFELGNGLRELDDNLGPKKNYFVDETRNELDPHCWDDDDVCLAVGTITMYLSGHHEGTLLPFEDAPDEESKPGRWVLLKTYPDPSLPQRAHMVRLTKVVNTRDHVFQNDITKISWQKEHALPFEMDMTVMKIHANILPATAGKTYTSYFVVGKDPDQLSVSLSLKRQLKRAVEREGSNRSPIYLFSLPHSEKNPLVWLGENPEWLEPEVQITEIDPVSEAAIPNVEWKWKRSLLGGFTSFAQDRNFTLESGTWKRVVGYQRIGEEIVHQDYSGSSGHTLRFGDSVFGLTPPEGTIFRVNYRLGNGARTNVPVDALTHFEDPLDLVQDLTNPLQGVGGMDSEPIGQVRLLAPEAFRAVTYRAVRPEDYAEAAERLDWVQRAGASFRWTGSWLSAFVTPDPLGSVSLNPWMKRDLDEQLDRFRQAGREAHVMAPRYADMDFEITICVEPFAYKGEVKQRVLTKLGGKKGNRPEKGFFSPDNFTFGTVFYRSVLEAFIQQVEGVRSVKQVKFRRRGWFDWKVFKSMHYHPGKDVIIRMENDPVFPEKGSLNLKMTGGL